LVAGRLRSADVAVVRQLDERLPAVLGNAHQLEQLFLHVINNATAAMTPRGGTLTVSTDAVDGNLVRMRFSDTGCGIAAENIDRVFEPFFTTKQDRDGKGLGLTVAYTIVEEHHGRIKIDSELYRGTTVSIILPTANRRAHIV
jgi:two-component system NtrC family sensor kinase